MLASPRSLSALPAADEALDNSSSNLSKADLTQLLNSGEESSKGTANSLSDEKYERLLTLIGDLEYMLKDRLDNKPTAGTPIADTELDKIEPPTLVSASPRSSAIAEDVDLEAEEPATT